MRLKPYSRDFFIRNNKMLPSEPSFGNLACMFPVFFKLEWEKLIQKHREMCFRFLLQSVEDYFLLNMHYEMAQFGYF